MIDYKEKGFLSEALVNGLALLGWNPPHREDPNALSEDVGQFLKHEVMKMEEMKKIF